MLHAMSKRGPHKQVKERQCNILAVPHEIARVKMKLKMKRIIECQFCKNNVKMAILLFLILLGFTQ